MASYIKLTPSSTFKRKQITKRWKSDVSFNIKSSDRIVMPWMSKMEWDLVKEKLFSSNIDDQIVALNRISVWKSRCDPKIPFGIEVTENLVRARMLHLKANNSNQAQIQHGDVVLLYSMALIRFVNLATELGQKGSSMKPVHVLAEEMDIPEWIVELRHEATHTNLPSLSALKMGWQLAMHWVKKHYWDREDVLMADDFSVQEPEEKPCKKFKKSQQKEKEIHSWELSTDDVNWEDYPLGTLPCNSDTNFLLNLDLPLHVDSLYQPPEISCNEENFFDDDDDDDQDRYDQFSEYKFIPTLQERLHIAKHSIPPLRWNDRQLETISKNITIF